MTKVEDQMERMVTQENKMKVEVLKNWPVRLHLKSWEERLRLNDKQENSFDKAQRRKREQNFEALVDKLYQAEQNKMRE